MKYLLVGLFSIPLLTACTTIQEGYGPYDQSPPPRAEVYQYVEPGQYHGHRPAQYQRGAYSGRGRQIQGRGPSNAYGHGQNTVVVPRNTHGHGQNTVVVPRNTHGHGQNTVVVPRNTHGHGQNTVVVPRNTHGHGQNTVVVPRNTHGHGQNTVVVPRNTHPQANDTTPLNNQSQVTTKPSSHSGTALSQGVKNTSSAQSTSNNAHAHN